MIRNTILWINTVTKKRCCITENEILLNEINIPLI